MTKTDCCVSRTDLVNKMGVYEKDRIWLAREHLTRSPMITICCDHKRRTLVNYQDIALSLYITLPVQNLEKNHNGNHKKHAAYYSPGDRANSVSDNFWN